jgi:hypothetical protein
MRIRPVFRTLLIVFIPCLLASPTSSAQEKKIKRKDVPAPVMEAFAKAYPRAKIRGTSVEAEKGTTYYEIESMDGSQARDLLYLPDGTVAEIEEVVPAAALPQRVKSAVGGEFPKAKIAKAEKVTKGTVVSYELHVTQGPKRGSIVLSPSGTVVKKSPLKAKTGKKESEEEEEED